MDTTDLVSFAKDYGIILLAVLGLIVGMVFLIGYMSLMFDILRKRESRFFSESTVSMIETLTKMAVGIGLAIYFSYLVQLLSPWIHENMWTPLLDFLPFVVVIATIIGLTMVLAKIADNFVSYLKGDLAHKPPKTFKGEYVGLLGLLVKYLLYAAAFFSIIIVVMIALGYASALGDWFSSFIARNIMFIGFIVMVVFISYFVNRFVTRFFSDLEAKSSKVSPQLARTGGTMVRIGVYVLAGLLVVFAILNMADLGGISQTILLIATTMIGLVVAMAGTGSIGNILSGAVLIGFRPFEKGDRVKLLSPAMVCDIVDVNLIFTKVRTLEGESLEIPNNLVLGATISNLTHSVPYAITMKTTIGYDVHHSTVEGFMKEAARRTRDVLDSPEPIVFASELGNYAIEYEVYAYTRNEKDAKRIRSDLLKNIQDVFYDNNVEILSPVYEVHRRGAETEKEFPPRPVKAVPRSDAKDNQPRQPLAEG